MRPSTLPDGARHARPPRRIEQQLSYASGERNGIAGWDQTTCLALDDVLGEAAHGRRDDWLSKGIGRLGDAALGRFDIGQHDERSLLKQAAEHWRIDRPEVRHERGCLRQRRRARRDESGPGRPATTTRRSGTRSAMAGSAA